MKCGATTFEKEVALIESYLKNSTTTPTDVTKAIRRKAKKFILHYDDDDALCLHYVGMVGACGAGGDASSRSAPPRKVVANPAEQQRLLKRWHDENGHFGRNRMRALLCRRFYWPSIVKDIDFYVKTCEVCQKTGLGRDIKHRPPLHPITVKGVWDEVGIDLIGPLKETRNGHRYIATLCDYFSKWAEAAPIKDKRATTIAEFLLSIMHRFGFPASIITDQGTEFNNAVMTELCRQTNCQHKVTSPYHPQCNGLVERFNQTLITGLQKVTNINKDDWDEKLDSFMFAYRSTVHESTKFSPFEIMFNRQPRMPPAVADETLMDERDVEAVMDQRSEETLMDDSISRQPRMPPVVAEETLMDERSEETLMDDSVSRQSRMPPAVADETLLDERDVEAVMDQRSEETLMDDSISRQPADDLFAKMQKISEVVKGKVKDNITKAQARQKKNYDRQHVIQNLQVGMKVWKISGRNATRKGDKLASRRTGPYIIHSYVSKGSYRLKREGQQEPMRQKVNGCYLTPFHDRHQKSVKGHPKEVAIKTDTKKATKDTGNIPRMQGIPNMGNTCYLNVVVQVLCRSPFMTAYTSQGDHSLPLLDSLLQVYQADGFSNVKKAVSLFKEACPKYGDKRQHDAGELLRDVLTSSCIQCGSGCTFLERWCHVVGKNIITCTECGQTHQGGAMQYSVVPVQGKGETLQDSWEMFVGTTDFSCVCDKCGHFQSQKLASPHILNAPDMLWIAINRWQEEQVVGRMWNEEDLPKNANHLEVPLVLDVMAANGILVEYRLNSLVLHHSTKMSSGHYTCLVMNEDGWYHIDDGKVRVTDPVLSDPAIYLIGYTKGDSLHIEHVTSPKLDESWKEQLPAIFSHLGKVVAGDVQSVWLHDLLHGVKNRVIIGHGNVPEEVENELAMAIHQKYMYVVHEEPKLGNLFRLNPQRLNVPEKLLQQLSARQIPHSRYISEVLLPEAVHFLVSSMSWNK